MNFHGPESDFIPDDNDIDVTLEDLEVEYTPESATPPAIVEDCDAVFAEDGMLAQAAARENRLYEYRPQQREMARAVAEALCAGENLCVEAPTGVGKSFAYLVPLVFRARRTCRPATSSPRTGSRASGLRSS